MDHLDKHLQSISDELNRIEQPDRQLIWKRIQHQRRQRRFRRNWLAAAAALALLLASAVVMRYQLDNSPETAALALLSPEQRTEIVQCRQTIAEKENYIRGLSPDADGFEEWQTELKSLDADQDQFLKDLAALPKDDRYAETLVRFYEQKVRILELFIKKIEIQSHEKERLAHIYQ